MSGFVISGDNEKKIRGTLVFMQITAVYVALVSVFGAYFSVFEAGIEFRTMCLMALVIVGAVHVLLFRTEHLGRRTFVIVLLTGCLAAVWKETLFKGIVPFVNAYIEQRNQFYSIEQPGMAQEPDILGCFAVAAIIQLLLGLILTVILRSGRGGILALLVMLLPVILAATVGHMPSYIASWGLLAAGVLYLMMYRRKTEGLKIQEIAAAAVVLAIFYGLGYVSAPLITAYKEEHRKEYDEIQEKIIDSQQVDVREMIENQLERSGDYLEGGIGEGDLRNLSGYHPQGVVEMEVAVDELPKSTVYLKAFVGTTYTGSKWKELKTSEFSDVISPIFGGTKRRELMNEPFDRIEKGNNNLTKQQMTITIKNASAGYGYSPYYAEVSDKDSVKLDAYVEGKNKKEREYVFFPRRQVERMDGSELAEESELWRSYQKFVQKAYVDFPDDLERLKDFCSYVDSSSVGMVAAEIDQRFAFSLRYTREPGKKPADQDFVEYFLFDNEQGFCVHFASAATLIYRECGYPARYVEGYAVSPEEFRRQEDGTYKAKVTDAMAHAWCETFDSETGWQVREHTLPYQEAAGRLEEEETAVPREDEPSVPREDELGDTLDEQDNESQKNEEMDSDEPDDENRSNAVENTDGEDTKGGSGSGDGAEGQNGFRSSVVIKTTGTAAGILVLLFICVLLCVVQQKLRRQKKLYYFRVKKNNRGITAMYDEICRICVFSGLKEKNQTDREGLEQMKKEFLQLSDEEWEWLYDCALRAAFAEAEIGREEWKVFYHLYRKLRKGVLQNMKGRKKLWFLYGKGM